MPVTLSSALEKAQNHYDLGAKFEKLGKKEKGRFGGRIYLAYDQKSGWNVRHLNIFQNLIRRVFGAYKSTHLTAIFEQLTKEPVRPSALFERIQALWNAAHPKKPVNDMLIHSVEDAINYAKQSGASLTSIDLSKINFESDSKLPLKEFLSYLPKLKIFKAEFCKFSDQNFQALTQKNLQELLIQADFFAKLGMVKIQAIADSDKFGSLLKLHLKTFGGGFEDAGAQILAQAKMKNLEELSLSGQQIRAAGVQALANGDFNKLKRLDLSSCPLGAKGAQALSEAVKFGNLELLDLSESAITLKDLETILQSKALKSLKTVIVKCNDFARAYTPAQLQAMKNPRNIQVVM